MPTVMEQNSDANQNLWSQNLWDEQYAKMTEYLEVPETDATRQFLESKICNFPMGNCMEVGC